MTRLRRAASRPFAILFATVLASRLCADDGALNEGAHGPEPVGGLNGPESVIAMRSEQLDIDFGRKETSVTARFVFRSAKKGSPAVQLVGFPDLAAAVKESERRDPDMKHNWHFEENITGPIQDMQTFIDGRPVQSDIKYGYVLFDPEEGPWSPGTPEKGVLMAWHTIKTEFPPDRDVTIERRYRVDNGAQIVAEPPNSQARYFFYTVSTGATWKGPIGRMTVNVRLRDGLAANDLGWPRSTKDYDNLMRPPKRGWEIVSPTQLKLVWKDFEPRTDKEKRSFRIAIKPERLQDAPSE